MEEKLRLMGTKCEMEATGLPFSVPVWQRQGDSVPPGHGQVGWGSKSLPAIHLPLPHPGNSGRKRCSPGATAWKNPRAKVDARTLSLHDQA